MSLYLTWGVHNWKVREETVGIKIIEKDQETHSLARFRTICDKWFYLTIIWDPDLNNYKSAAVNYYVEELETFVKIEGNCNLVKGYFLTLLQSNQQTRLRYLIERENMLKEC